MKAIIYHNYGPPDVLKYEEIEKPTPGDNDVLIRIRAASVNPLDWHFMRGTPYFMRLMAGLSKPKSGRLGADVAGEVEAIGKNVTRFKPGNQVFGVCRGAFAEYGCAPESKLAIKPENVSFEQAASVPIAAVTALQGLRDHGKTQPGQKLLINGAAGGVGTFAVQIGKWLGAEVTGVCSTRNLEMVRSLGADHVIDYTRENFTASGQAYDVFLDNVGNRSLSECRRALRPKGKYVSVGGGGPNEQGLFGPGMARWAKAPLLSWFVSQDMRFFMADINPNHLATLVDLIAAEKITPLIDRQYKLSETPEAMRYLEQGHARGKVVITVT